MGSIQESGNAEIAYLVVAEIIYEQICRFDVTVDDPLLFTAHQRRADIPADLQHLRDGKRLPVPLPFRQQLPEAGEQLHPHKQHGGRCVFFQVVVINRNNIGSTLEGFHDLDHRSKSFRDKWLTRLSPVLCRSFRRGKRGVCLSSVADPDQFQGGQLPDLEIVPVDLKDIANSPSAQASRDMPLRPKGLQLFLYESAFEIIVIHVYSSFPVF